MSMSMAKLNALLNEITDADLRQNIREAMQREIDIVQIVVKDDHIVARNMELQDEVFGLREDVERLKLQLAQTRKANVKGEAA